MYVWRMLDESSSLSLNFFLLLLLTSADGAGLRYFLSLSVSPFVSVPLVIMQASKRTQARQGKAGKPTRWAWTKAGRGGEAGR